MRSNNSHSSLGLLMRISPLIYGRHHKTCTWILHELFHHVSRYLPKDLECHDTLTFRNIFNIRVGSFRSNQRITVAAYHLHSTTPLNIDKLINAIHTYSKSKQYLPTIFNMKIMIDLFSTKLDRKLKANMITERISNIHIFLKCLIKVTLKYSIDLEGLIAFCVTFDRRSFYITLLFTNNNIPNHYYPKLFSNIFKDEKETATPKR